MQVDRVLLEAARASGATRVASAVDALLAAVQDAVVAGGAGTVDAATFLAIRVDAATLARVAARAGRVAAAAVHVTLVAVLELVVTGDGHLAALARPAEARGTLSVVRALPSGGAEAARLVAAIDHGLATVPDAVLAGRGLAARISAAVTTRGVANPARAIARFLARRAGVASFGADAAAVDASFVSVPHAVVAAGGGTPAVTAAARGAVDGLDTSSAVGTTGAGAAAAVDAALGSILQSVFTRWRGAHVRAWRTEERTLTVGIGRADLPGGARRALATAVHGDLATVLRAVLTGRAGAHACGTTCFATITRRSTRLLKRTGRARTAAVDVRLVAVEHAVLAELGASASEAGADAARADVLGIGA